MESIKNKARINSIVVWLYNITSFFALLLMIASCESGDERDMDSASSPSKSVIIIEDYKEVNRQIDLDYSSSDSFNNPEVRVKTSVKSVLTFTNPGILLKNGNRERTIKPKNEYESLVFTVNGDYAVLIYRIMENEFDRVVIYPGDTVLLSYGETIPSASIKNRSTLYGDLNFFQNYLKGENDLLSASSHIGYEFTIKNFSSEMPFLRAVNSKERYDRIFEKLSAQNNYLDSLWKIKQISEDNYAIHWDRIYYDNMVLRMNSGDTLSYDEAFKTIEDYNGKETRISHSHFEKFLDSFISKYIVSQAPIIVSSQGKGPDYAFVYDTIRDLDYLEIYREKLLVKYYERLVINNSYTISKKYSEKLKYDVSDSVMVGKISSKYRWDLDSIRMKTEDLVLLDRNENKSTLSAVLKSLKGNLVYVDMWASWCVPCLAQMPFAQELYNEYKNKGVSFVYLSSDLKITDWVRGSKNEDLYQKDLNFLMVNKDNSTFLDDLKFRYIPRYLLFDAEGNLIHKNAPQPGSDEIRKLLESLIPIK
ncbi:MAG: TlpA family protein disulfide reductase [Cyclobacteriaceae bacterium]|nr:TlpA family protein disulfide reductase [Cyclobacteriaceae bacterium]